MKNNKRILPNNRGLGSLASGSKKGLRILVTGGAGFLGSILVPALLREGHRVTVLDRLFFGDEGLRAHRNDLYLRIIQEDILYHENIPGLFRDIDVFIHLASISNDPSCDLNPNLTIQTNFLATMSLARRALSSGVRRFIFTSSCSVYGAGNDRLLDVNSPTGPVTLYALSKLQCERELLRLQSSRFQVTILRLATLFGASPRMRFDLAVNAMAKRALQGKSIMVNGDGSQFRPFVHVADAARAIMTVLRASKERIAGEIFNIGSESLNYSITDLAKEIQKQFPDIKIEHVAYNNDIRSYRIRCRRTERILGFSAALNIADGIREIDEAYKRGDWPDMDDPKFYNVMVMKAETTKPVMGHSLASSPFWISREPLIRSI